MRVQLVDEEQMRYQISVDNDDDKDYGSNEKQFETEKTDLELNTVLKMIFKECLLSFTAGPTRVFMKRSLLNCANLLGLIFFKGVLLLNTA